MAGMSGDTLTKTIFRLLLIQLVIGTALCAEAPRIMIVTDMEGVGGVNDADEQLMPGQRRYDESRHLLAGEVNAAVEGARSAGATEIVILDGHDGSRALSVDDIHPAAKLIQGRPMPANYYLARGEYDGVMFVGQHAKAGAKNAVLPHSQTFKVRRIMLNGREVGEIGEIAAVAGYFDIPIIMLSGDQAACDEFGEIQPGAPTVAVKRLVGKASTLSISHVQAKRRIEDASHLAVLNIRSFHPWKITGPVELVFDFLPQPPLEPMERIVRYHGDTVLAAFEAWLGKL
jgi:D-amino peptidase